MAAAFAARRMGVPATIVVPSSSPQLVVQRLQDQGAAVKIVGKVMHFYRGIRFCTILEKKIRKRFLLFIIEIMILSELFFQHYITLHLLSITKEQIKIDIIVLPTR